MGQALHKFIGPANLNSSGKGPGKECKPTDDIWKYLFSLCDTPIKEPDLEADIWDGPLRYITLLQ